MTWSLAFLLLCAFFAGLFVGGVLVQGGLQLRVDEQRERAIVLAEALIKKLNHLERVDTKRSDGEHVPLM